MQTKYERQSFQFLSLYRFISYALAVMFTQVSPAIGVVQMPEDQVIIILTALGVYTLLRVFSPLRWQERSLITYVILAGDFVVCLFIVVFTNGLNSGFLLYSLTPIMTAALFFEEKVAFSLAVTASLVLSLTHLLLNPINSRITQLLEGHNLTTLIIYSLFCLVTALVPYRINLNIRRRIERDAIMEERRRLGRELHDGVAQTISYLNLKTKLVRDFVSSNNTQKALVELDDINKVAQNTYEDIRESIDQLSVETRNLPLITTLADYVAKFSGKNNIKVSFEFTRPFPPLSPVAELQLLRIAQEALTNIRRHAQASEVEVRLNSNGKAMDMIVKDNGKGFHVPGQDDSTLGYHGLTIIKERAEGLGGTVAIFSEPGNGTEVKINLPIEKVRL
ncbi:MAG: sensor histidine kinase [Dehalococcoidales bacterium]|nr:sensor histidine kinase [Dehalococcoidales bacterium]